MASLSGFGLASGSGFGVALETDSCMGELFTDDLCTNEVLTEQLFFGTNIIQDGSTETMREILNGNHVLETNIVDHDKTDLNNSSEVSSLGSNPGEASHPDDNIFGYLLNNQSNSVNLGECDANNFQTSDQGCIPLKIQDENIAQNDLLNVDGALKCIEYVDTNILQTSGEPEHKQTSPVEIHVNKTCSNKKKRYSRHKKGQKQLSKNEVKDEGQWKNIGRCRDYRSKKKSNVSEEVTELQELEDESKLLKIEEDQRKERVTKMKDMYIKLISEGQIKFS